MNKVFIFWVVSILYYRCLVNCNNDNSQKYLNNDEVRRTVNQINHFDNLFVKGEMEYRETCNKYTNKVLFEESVSRVKFVFDSLKYIATTNNQDTRYKPNGSVDEEMRYVPRLETHFFDGENKYLLNEISYDGLSKKTCRIYLGPENEKELVAPLLNVFSAFWDMYIRSMSTYIDESNIIKISKIDADGKILKIDAVIRDENKNPLLSSLRPVMRFSSFGLSSGNRIECIIDTEKQYLPKQVILYLKNGNIYEKMIATAYCQDKQGNWLPGKTVLLSYDDNGVVKHEEIIENIKANLNSAVVFNFNIPERTIISDYRKGEIPVEYQALSALNYSEIQDVAIAEKEGKIVILSEPGR